MKQTIANRLRYAVLAALAAGAVASTTRAADLVAYWDFEKVEADGTTINTVQGKATYAGTIVGSAALTAAGGGRPGGGKGFSVGADTPGKLLLEATGDANPMNIAAADDHTTVVLWQKNNSNVNSSSFWANADSQDRGFQFHVPWSDGTIYFDTSGCCAAPGQRLNQNVAAAIDGFDWTAWHHYAFVKDGEAKRIYVDGTLLVEQTEGVAPLATDFNRLNIGADGGAAYPDAVMDDFAIFKGALTEAEIKKIAGGAAIGVPPVDTDKDGMPDYWEILYGLNPNDPSDAAKDLNKNGISNLDEFKMGLDPSDITHPAVNSAAGTGTFDTVVLTFSKTLDAVSATTLANYTITPALAVKSASVKKNVVTLTTDKQAPGATQYTVAVKNVRDISRFAVATDTKATFFSFLNVRDGVLKMSIYKNILTTAIQALYDAPNYPNSPDVVGAVFSANSRDLLPTDSLDNYGATMNGFLTPADSGAYDFFLRSDDSSQFYISTDDKEANLSLVAEEVGCCGAFQEPGDPRTTASPINLVGGKKYAISIVYKEGGGGDYGQVAWRKVGDTTPAGSLTPITGKFLSSAVDLAAAPEGAYVTQSPGVKAKGVSPAAGITIAHRDGKTAWTAANTSLKLDGVAVTPTVTKDGQVITIKFKPSSLFASGSVHTIDLGYPDPAGKAAVATWSFTAGTYNGITVDSVGGYKGLLLGAAVISADGVGHTGKAGDRAIDLTKKGGPVAVFDDKFLGVANAATANDELTVSFWQKKYDVADSSAFTLDSPSAGNNRNFHAHVPWSNQNVYFDTVGCCDGATQRITADIATFPDYSGSADWWTTQWHHFVFTKKGADKNIYIDGKLFLNGQSTNPLKTDSQAFYMGSGAGGGEVSHAIIDDFAVFNKALTIDDALAITKGTSPSALPAAKGLIAFWDYNAAPLSPNILSTNDTIVASSANSPSSGAEGVKNVLDGKSSTKYLNFDKLNTGFTVTPAAGSSIINGITITSANDSPERDPASYLIEGSNDGVVFTKVASGDIAAFSARFTTQTFTFVNTAVYKTYRVTFPKVANAATANSMQVADVGLLGTAFGGVAAPTIAVGLDGKITFTGTLHGSDNAAGPFAPVAGATSPFAPNTGAAAQKFYRSSN